MDNKLPPIFEKIRARYGALKAEKSGIEATYDILARFVMGRNNYTNTEYNLGAEDLIDPELFDNTAHRSNMLMSASHVGALWPNSTAAFELSAPFELQDHSEETEEIATYLRFVKNKLGEAFDVPEAGLVPALMEYMAEQGCFGLSGIFHGEDPEDDDIPFRFRVVNAKDLYYDLDVHGIVDTVYIRRCMNLREIRQEYGHDAVSDKEMESYYSTATAIKSNEVIQAITPNSDYGVYEGSAGMKYKSCHLDITRNKPLREGGYHEMPVYVGRFYRLLGEKYPRSPGYEAYPDIREINQIRYGTILAQEKLLDPPLGVIENSIVGNGDVVDLSPGKITVISASTRLGNYNGKPIEPLVDVGDPQGAYQRLGELVENIKNHFMEDRILDLNNENQMTLGEVNVRNGLRGQVLNPFYAGQEKDVFQRMIERGFNILFRRGQLGVIRGSDEDHRMLAEGVQPTYIPDVLVDRMINGREVYRIRFISPASRIKHMEEAQGIMETLQALSGFAQVNPEVLDCIDVDRAFRRLAELKGAPASMLHSDEQIKAIRDNRAQQQQQQAELMMKQQAAATAKDMAKAQADMEKNGG